MWRRVRLIPFTVVIPKVEQDKGLLDKLKVELEGILAWAVRGCLAWQQEGLEPPECVETATKAYQIAQDVLGAFLEECCLLQADLTAPTGNLYAAYKTWCGENNEKCLTQTTLAERLKEKGLENDRNSITGRKQWRGVGLRITPVERES